MNIPFRLPRLAAAAPATEGKLKTSSRSGQSAKNTAGETMEVLSESDRLVSRESPATVQDAGDRGLGDPDLACELRLAEPVGFHQQA